MVTAIIHTFDGYERFHLPMLYFWYRFAPASIPVIFTFETCDPFPIFQKVQALLKGDLREPPTFVPCGAHSTWTGRLKKALEYTQTPYCIYLQEDIWLTQAFSTLFIHQCIEYMQNHKLLLLKLQGHAQGAFDWPLKLPLDWNDPSVYVFSHQPFLASVYALWNWSFILPIQRKMQQLLKINPVPNKIENKIDNKSCEYKIETPFQHETFLNKYFHYYYQDFRMKSNNKKNKNKNQNKNSFHLPITWLPQELEDQKEFMYQEVSLRGQLSYEGSQMLLQYQLPMDLFHQNQNQNQNKKNQIWTRADA